MERKLSQKATRMRRHLSFNRNSQLRDRASTVTTSDSVSERPTSRPHSSTIPDASTSTTSVWDNSATSRCYNFTDEPGYFRPDSPLMDRQAIDGDLEDNVKHACALLVQSIERGVPIWPSSHHTGLPDTPTQAKPIQASANDTEPSSRRQYQRSYISPPKAIDKEIRVCNFQHDSGVAMSLSVTSASNGRFYGKRRCSSPSANESLERGRARGRSFATDTTAPWSRTPSQSRSRSSSRALFPYSPPRLNAQWAHLENCDPDPPGSFLSELNAVFSTEGLAWLHTSLDVEPTYNHNYNYKPESSQTKDPRLTSAPGTSTGLTAPGPPPRRFYSVRQATSQNPSRSQQDTTHDIPCGSISSSSRRGSIMDYPPSLQNISDETLDKPAQDFPFPTWRRPENRPLQASGIESHENVYSTVIPTASEPRHRRKKASHLLKKLAGLGMRRKDVDTPANRKGRKAVEVVA